MSVYEERARARADALERSAREFVALTRRHTDIVAVYAFGSFGTGRVGPHSDLDFLIVRETTLVGPGRGMDLFGEARLDVPFDLIVVTPEEYRERLPETSFGRTILASARRLDAA